MTGTDILHASAISPKLLYSAQLPSTATSLYQPATGTSARIFTATVCNATSSQAAPVLSTTLTYTQIIAPTVTLGTTATSGGTFASGTYYWKITSTTAVGETTGSNEVTATLATNGTQILNWAVIGTASGYKIYRGTAAGSENVLVTTITSGATTTYLDTGVAGTAATVPSTNTSGGGSFSAGTYFWVVTAVSASGETIASNELTATLTVNSSVVFTWTTITAATSYHFYRGTATGAENHLIATIASGTTTYTDTGTTGTSQSPVTTSTFATPVNIWLSLITSGGSMDGTHRVANNVTVPVDNTLNLTPFLNGTMLGPGDYLSAHASVPGAVSLVVSGTVHT
jgi:hypothetical protein